VVRQGLVQRGLQKCSIRVVIRERLKIACKWPQNPSTSFRLTFTVRAGQKGPAFGRNGLPKGVTPLELINFPSKYVKAFRSRACHRAGAEAGIGETPMWIGAGTERVMDKFGSGKSDVSSRGGQKMNPRRPTQFPYKIVLAGGPKKAGPAIWAIRIDHSTTIKSGLGPKGRARAEDPGRGALPMCIQKGNAKIVNQGRRTPRISTICGPSHGTPQNDVE
jgi:hypothetical protein